MYEGDHDSCEMNNAIIQTYSNTKNPYCLVPGPDVHSTT